jgi:hypothetical protein
MDSQRPKIGYFAVSVTNLVKMVLHRRTTWHSRHTDCLPVVLDARSRKRNVSLFHLPTTTGSPAFRKETSHYDRFSMQFWLTPHTFSRICCFCLPYCTDNFLSMRKCKPLRHFARYSHTCSSAGLFNNSVHTFSRWCNAKGKPSTKWSPQNNTRTIRE